MLTFFVKEIVKEIWDLYWMQKAKHQSENDVLLVVVDDDEVDGGEITSRHFKMNFKGICYVCGKKDHRKQICLKRPLRLKK